MTRGARHRVVHSVVQMARGAWHRAVPKKEKKLERKINKAAAKMFRDFPPKNKKK